MKSKSVQVLVAIAGLAAVVYGITQILGGVDEMQASKSLTRTDARAIADQAAANLKEFVAEEQGLAFSYPKNWTTERPQTPPIFFKWKMPKSTVNGSVMMEELGPGVTLVDYVKSCVDQTLANLTRDQMAPHVVNRDQLQVGGEDALRVRFGFTLPDQKLEGRVAQTFFVKGNRVYGITLTTPADLHESFDGLMTRILDSVRFLG